MNKKDCLIFCTVIIMSVLFVFHTVYEDRTRTFQYREAYNKKCAYIGGITIGTDSLEAIGFIKKRLKYIMVTWKSSAKAIVSVIISQNITRSITYILLTEMSQGFIFTVIH